MRYKKSDYIKDKMLLRSGVKDIDMQLRVINYERGRYDEADALFTESIKNGKKTNTK